MANVIDPDPPWTTQFAPSEISIRDEPATAGNVTLLALTPVTLMAPPMMPWTMTLPVSCDDVMTCAEGDVDLKMNRLPGAEAAVGIVIVSAPWEAERIFMPTSCDVTVALAVRVRELTTVIDPSNPLPGS